MCGVNDDIRAIFEASIEVAVQRAGFVQDDTSKTSYYLNELNDDYIVQRILSNINTIDDLKNLLENQYEIEMIIPSSLASTYPSYNIYADGTSPAIQLKTVYSKPVARNISEDEFKAYITQGVPIQGANLPSVISPEILD